MATYSMKVYNSYLQAFQKLFDLSPATGEKFDIVYAIDQENKTVTFFDKLEVKYSVEKVEVCPFVYKNTVKLEATIGEDKFEDSYVLHVNTEHEGTFEMARKIFNSLIANYKSETVRRSNFNPEERAKRELGKLISKYMNQGMELQAAIDAANADVEAKKNAPEAPKQEVQQEVSQAPEGEEVSPEDIDQEF